MKTLFEQLSWRNAHKTFDPSKQVDPEKLKLILEAVRMAPTSFGTQPFHVFVVSNPETKAKLRAAGYNQAQYTDASHILVFASRTDHMERVEGYFQIATGGDSEKRAAMAGYEEMMRGAMANLQGDRAKTWADRQTYIALGFALAAAAELEVDSCPMEGFSPEQFDEILGLPAYMKTVVTMSIGVSDGTPARGKVRFPENDLFTFLA